MDSWGEVQGNPQTSSLAGRVDIRSRHTMVNIPWLTSYLLLVTVEGKASKDRDPARLAKELFTITVDGISAVIRAQSTLRRGVIGHQCTRSVWNHGSC